MRDNRLVNQRIAELTYGPIIDGINRVEDLIHAKDKLITPNLRSRYEERCVSLFKNIKEQYPPQQEITEITCKRVIQTRKWDDITFCRDIVESMKLGIIKGEELTQRGDLDSKITDVWAIFQTVLISFLVTNPNWRIAGLVLGGIGYLFHANKAEKDLSAGKELLAQSEILVNLLDSKFVKWARSIGDESREVDVDLDVSGMKFLIRILQTA